MEKVCFNYGEILFLGRCNNKCYYCLGNEMPKAKLVSNLNTPYKELKNLDMFLNLLKIANTNTIYLSSVITDPLLYEDISNLCDYLVYKGFKVGIRTNGICNNFIDIIPKLEAEISISINSLSPAINKKICGNGKIPDIDKIFSALSSNSKKCRISIVVNRYNYADILSTIKLILKYNSKYNDLISYIQLRRRYLYGDKNDLMYHKDIEAFENVKLALDKNSNKYGKSNFHESVIYKYHTPISLWEDVFNKESLSSLNYFSDGKITNNNLLVPSYEKE